MSEHETPPPNTVEQAREAIAEVRGALQSGRAPRGRRPLQLAARALKAADLPVEAAEALRTQAELELRRDDPTAALTPARSALRLVRQDGGAEALRCLELVSRLYARVGDRAQAERFAREWLARAAEIRHRPEIARAQRRLAQLAWEEGDRSAAFDAAEAALETARTSGDPIAARAAERSLAVLLLWAGCPADAADRLTRLVRGAPEDSETARSLLARGWAWRVLGRDDAAARDFRRAHKLLQELPDPRPAVEAAAALAAVELARARQDGSAPRQRRADALASRVERQGRRYRDAALQRRVAALLSSDGTEASASGSGAVKQHAAGLVALARSAASATLVDACIAEVHRLNGLPAGEPPYHASCAAPLSLE